MAPTRRSLRELAARTWRWCYDHWLIAVGLIIGLLIAWLT